MTEFPVYKDSNGDFVCRACNKIYTTMDQAMECADEHERPKREAAELQRQDAITASETSIDDYEKIIRSGDTIEAARRLCLSMIRDYEINRQVDIQKYGKPGPLTLNTGRAASEALGNLNKLVFGEKSTRLTMNLDAKKKTDLEALHTLLGGKREDHLVEVAAEIVSTD